MIAITTRLFAGRLSIEIEGISYFRIGRFSLYTAKDDYRPARFIEVCGPSSGLCKPSNWIVFALGRRFMLSRQALGAC